MLGSIGISRSLRMLVLCSPVGLRLQFRNLTKVKAAGPEGPNRNCPPGVRSTWCAAQRSKHTTKIGCFRVPQCPQTSETWFQTNLLSSSAFRRTVQRSV